MNRDECVNCIHGYPCQEHDVPVSPVAGACDCDSQEKGSNPTGTPSSCEGSTKDVACVDLECTVHNPSGTPPGHKPCNLCGDGHNVVLNEDGELSRGGKLVVDPPSGWQYGFPAVYDPRDDETEEEWFLRKGYPQAEIDRGSLKYCRWWDYAPKDKPKGGDKSG